MERGTHEELVAQAGAYQKPFQSQLLVWETSSGYLRRTASSALRRYAMRGTLERSPREEDPCPQIWVQYAELWCTRWCVGIWPRLSETSSAGRKGSG